jgi:4'-phosphopantetheinyl transferase EntD
VSASAVDHQLFALPHGLGVAVPIPADAAQDPAALAELAAALHPEERRHLATLGPGRQPGFAAGRVALRAALAAQGLPSGGPLLSDERGAPRLPAGALGSISHKRALAIAVAAPAGPDGAPAALGVDLEEDRPLRVDISRRVLTERERTELAASPPDRRDRDLIIRFCLKEAFYKAVNPFVRRYVSFLDVLVDTIARDGHASFQAHLLEEQGLSAAGWVGSPCAGRLAGYLVACVRADQRPDVREPIREHP